MTVGELVRTRRVELGLTPRELSSRVGLRVSVLRDIEANGSVDSLSLGQIRALERATGSSILAATEPTPAVDGAAEAGDAAALGALLLKWQPEGQLGLVMLAQAFGWSLARCKAAWRTLEIQLAESGGAIIEGENGALQIVGAQLPEVAKAERYLTCQPASFDLDDDSLEILLDIAECHGVRVSRLYNDYAESDRRRIAQLVALGLIETEEDRLELTARAAISLDPVLHEKRASKSWTFMTDLRSSRRPAQ